MSDNLLFDAVQLANAELGLPKRGKLLAHEGLGSLVEALVRSKIHAEDTHVTVGRIGTFDVVRHPVAFPHVQAQPIVHGGATEMVGDESQAYAIGMVTAVGQGAHNMVHLVDVFFKAEIERGAAFKRGAV